MSDFCSTKSCPKDHVFAILRGNKLYRLTFSRSLADHIVKKLDDYQVERVKFVLGKELFGEKSKTGLYAITNKKGWALRITLFYEMVDLFEDPSRRVFECYLDI